MLCFRICLSGLPAFWVVCASHSVYSHLPLCLSVNHSHFLAVGLTRLMATSMFHILCAGRYHKGITILQQLNWLFNERKHFRRCYDQASTLSKYTQADFLLSNILIPSCPTLVDFMQAVMFENGSVQKPWCECLPVWGDLILIFLDLNHFLCYLIPFCTICLRRWLRKMCIGTQNSPNK